MAGSALTDLQVEVLGIFFALPEATGFVLAGGAGLVAAGLSERPTDDLDLFSAASPIEAAGDALEGAVIERSWSSERIQSSDAFRRLVVRTAAGAQLLVDLARDSAPIGATITTAVGPTYAPIELAARKALALFDRAALRDFVDLHAVSAVVDRDEVLELAAEVDPGFDRTVFAQMLDTLARFTDEQIAPSTDPADLRAFFADWASGLRHTPPS